MTKTHNDNKMKIERENNMQKNIIKNWFTNHKTQSIGMVVTLLAIIAFSAYVVLKDNKQKDNIIQKQENKKGTYVLAVDDKPYNEEGNEQVIDPSAEKIENTDPSKANTLTNQETTKTKNNTNNSKAVQTVSTNNNVTTNNVSSTEAVNTTPKDKFSCPWKPTGKKRKEMIKPARDEVVVVKNGWQEMQCDGYNSWAVFKDGHKVPFDDDTAVMAYAEKIHSRWTAVEEPINPRYIDHPAVTKVVHHEAEYKWVDEYDFICD